MSNVWREARQVNHKKENKPNTNDVVHVDTNTSEHVTIDDVDAMNTIKECFQQILDNNVGEGEMTTDREWHII